MPETVVITEEMIVACQTKRGGYTLATIEAFGLSWPPRVGWVKRLVGREISVADYEKAVNGTKQFASPVGARRRKPIPTKIKLEIVLRQDGFCACGCKQKLDALREGIEFNHTPPLALREWSEADDDCTPPANDPEHIEALRKPCHAKKTNGKPHTSHGSDKHAIAHANRLANGPKKSKHKWPKRKLSSPNVKKKVNGDVVPR